MNRKQKSIIQENLVTLYLRLNGYFVNGFIVHSNENGRVKTEVDIIAIRFPHHKQDDTEHNSSPVLEIGDNIDIIVGEVKSNGGKLQFNKPLRSDKVAWEKILNWIGILNADQINLAADELMTLVQPKENNVRNNLLSTSIINTEFGKLAIRPIFFSPERSSKSKEKIILWPEINSFILSCLCPLLQRNECSTVYDYTSWGHLSDLVKVYKNYHKANNKIERIQDIYGSMEIK